MKAFDLMLQVENELKLINEKDGTQYFDNFESDLFVVDKGIVQFSGTEANLIWQVFENGTGTKIYNIQSDSQMEDFRDNQERKSKLYTISIDENEEASLTEVNPTDAEKFIEENFVPGKEATFRPMLIEEIAKNLGLSSTQQLSNNLKHGICLTPGEDILFKAYTDESRERVVCEMVKPELVPDPKGTSRTKSQTGTYTMRIPEQWDDIGDKPVYFKATPSDDQLFGKIEAISAKIFSAAERKVEGFKSEPGIR